MTLSAFRYKAWILIGITTLASAAFSQRVSSPGATPPRTSSGTSRSPNTPDLSPQPVFISGKVMLEGGGALPEPVAIERVCNNVNRREGYSDAKGQFQFQLGSNTTFQDASEEDTRVGISQPRQSTSRAQRSFDLTGCEFRAVLAGYQSSTAMIRTSGDGWQYDVGTIFLKRLGDAPGTTISVTSMAAPKNAMHAYEKAEKALEENPGEAEKQLHKAVQEYPQFAAAWTLLGDIHYEKGQLEEARGEYSRAVAADPQYVRPEYGLAVIAVQEKNWSDAAQFSAEVLKMNALAFPMAYFFNAAANYNQQKYDDAEESAKKFKAVDTQHRHPDVCLLLSQIYSRKQDYAGAARELRDYLAAAPNAPDAESIKTEAKRFEDLSVSAQRH